MNGGVRRTLKRSLSSLASRFFKRPRLTPDQLLGLRPRAVLIVRQHNQMGDMVCATPSFRALRGAFPGARLILVTSPVNSAVVSHNPDLDQVVVFAQGMWRRPWRLIGFWRSLRTARPEIAFVLSSVSFSLTSAAIALASGARWVVGADSRPFGWDVSRHAFSLEMPAVPDMDRHAIAHSLAPLQAVGIDTDDHSTVVVPSPEETAEALAILRDLGLERGFWAMHPGAGKAQNIWPAERFAAVAALAAAAGRRILVLHGPADGEALAGFRRNLAPPSVNAVALAPACSVGTGAALLQAAERFLCNDTGVMHIAGALKVPTVALFGPTDPDLWKPPAAEVRALRSIGRQEDRRGPEFGWMEGLTVEQVWKTWSELQVRGLPCGLEGE